MTRSHRLAAAALAAMLALPATAQDAEKTLYFYNWTDYYPVELLAKFEAETGIKVILDGFDSNDTLLAKLQSGGAAYDVIVPSDYVIPGMIADGLLLKIDTNAMENYVHMKDAFKNPDFDPTHEYTAPYLWGVTGLAYDSAQVEGGVLEASWKEYFEPRPELEGKIAALDTASDVILAASLYLGIPQCTESNDDAKRILELLEAQKPKLKLTARTARWTGWPRAKWRCIMSGTERPHGRRRSVTRSASFIRSRASRCSATTSPSRQMRRIPRMRRSSSTG